MPSSHVVPDQVGIAFDDERSVTSAGLLLTATLAERLGIEQVTDRLVDLGDRPGAAQPGRKLLTLVHAIVAGRDCIDELELLRCGSTQTVLGHRVMAASTVGTFLRSFTFGHVRQRDRGCGELLARAWAAGAGPVAGPLTVDVDSTICEVHGYHKQGACYGSTHRLGFHPLLATRANTGEVLHTRLRKSSANTARGILRFVDELIARLRRAGACGELTLRMDSGFWSAKLIRRLRRHRVRYSLTVRQTKTFRAAIAAIPEAAWVPIAYQPDGVAQVTETDYRGGRLIVRRAACHHLRVYDVSDLADPVQIGEYRTPNSLGTGAVGAGDYSIHNPLVVGETLYASWYSDGVRVLDVSDPTSPTEVAFFVPPAGHNPVKPPQRGVLSQMPQVWGVYYDAERDLVLASDMNTGLWILRVTT